MPKSIVKTKIQEKAWAKAKKIAKRQYPDIFEKDDKFWSIVMSIYKKMIG